MGEDGQGRRAARRGSTAEPGGRRPVTLSRRRAAPRRCSRSRCVGGARAVRGCASPPGDRCRSRARRRADGYTPRGRRRARPHDALGRRRHARGGRSPRRGRPGSRSSRSPTTTTSTRSRSRATGTASSCWSGPSCRRRPATCSASASTATRRSASTATACDALQDVREPRRRGLRGAPVLGPRRPALHRRGTLPGPVGNRAPERRQRVAAGRSAAAAGRGPLPPQPAATRCCAARARPTRRCARWDEMLARRDVVGLAGADAHSRLPLTRRRVAPLPVVRGALLARSPAPGARPAAVGRRRRRPGRGASARSAAAGFYVGLDALAPGERLLVRRSRAGGGRWTMGETVAPVVRARGPGPAAACREGTRLVLLRDGEAARRGARCPRRGAARRRRLPRRGAGAGLAACRGSITNPVYVFDEATREARHAAAAWPRATSAVGRDAAGRAAGQRRLHARVRPDVLGRAAVAGPGARPGRGGRARLAFRLGAPTPAQPFTWCALVNRQARDLSGWTGLRFRIRADGEYRAVGPGARREPGLGGRGARVVAGLGPHLRRSGREVSCPSRASARSTRGRTAGSTSRRRGRSCSCSTAPRSRPGTQGTIWIDGRRRLPL